MSNSPLSKNHVEARQKIIGIYGLPGAGKTFLLNQLEKHLDPSHFLYFEGSKVIDNIVPGGLAYFKTLDEKEKYKFRCESINHIKEECKNKNKVGIITGHFSFWEDSTQKEPTTVLTHEDYNTYKYIVYLKIDPNLLIKRRQDDKLRQRPTQSSDHIDKWQNTEIRMLKEQCRQHRILFIEISKGDVLTTAVKLINDEYHHDEQTNLDRAKKMMNKAVKSFGDCLETILVIDGDKTLSEKDASALVWQEISRSYPLKDMFQSPLKYSYEAFRQATLLLEEAADERLFEEACEKVANKVALHEEIRVLLDRTLTTDFTGAVVVTSGIRRVWTLILEKHSLSKIPVVGGGRISDKCVISRDVKTALVEYLRRTLNLYVFACGDSPLDLGMLKAANMASVVVGPENTRSRSMQQELQKAIRDDGLQIDQVLLPETVSKLNCHSLATKKLTNEDFLDTIFCRRVKILTLPDHAAKLLMTPTRDARIFGTALRDAHQRIGYNLTIDLMAKIVGVEKYDIPHVQGKTTDGYRIANEKSTTIIALMRGGEPMAFGVAEALPKAMFVHAYRTDDIKDHHLAGQSTIIIVDSVINTGRSVVEFILDLRKNSAARIIVVAGVIQQEAVCEEGGKRGLLAKVLHNVEDIAITALRISENKFTGSGGTDTGNRLFNTPHIL